MSLCIFSFGAAFTFTNKREHQWQATLLTERTTLEFFNEPTALSVRASSRSPDCIGPSHYEMRWDEMSLVSHDVWVQGSPEDRLQCAQWAMSASGLSVSVPSCDPLPSHVMGDAWTRWAWHKSPTVAPADSGRPTVSHGARPPTPPHPLRRLFPPWASGVHRDPCQEAASPWSYCLRPLTAPWALWSASCPCPSMATLIGFTGGRGWGGHMGGSWFDKQASDHMKRDLHPDLEERGKKMFRLPEVTQAKSLHFYDNCRVTWLLWQI